MDDVAVAITQGRAVFFLRKISGCH